MSMLLLGDTIITAGNSGDFDFNYIHVNFADWKTGSLLRNDSILYKPKDADIVYLWNTMYFNNCIMIYMNDILIGLNYYNISGSSIKWQIGVFSLNQYNLLDLNLAEDTFKHYFAGGYVFDDKLYIINRWMDPDNEKAIYPNFEILSINTGSRKKSIFKAFNRTLKYWNMIRDLLDDNQSDNTFFVNRELAWDFRGVPMAFENYIWKMDTTGNLVWSAPLYYNDSLNMAGCHIVQKNKGNLLAMWNNFQYKPYRHPEWRSIEAQPNDSSTLCLAEVDYETGAVINRRSYRKYLFKHMTHSGSFPKSETVQDFLLMDVLKVTDGIIWAGTRTLFQYVKPYTINMPFLFKTDFSGKPLWYRDYIVFPDSETDEGMLLNAIVHTPDGGFVMAGENRDFGRYDVQRSILVKVDSFGCLIPGCQKRDNINETVKLKCGIYPNPANSSLAVTLPPGDGNWVYQITDATGRLLLQGSLSRETNQIPTHGLPVGIYQLHLQNTKNQYHENHSFVVVR
ncbi:MAG: T9SS type A sorting domain-containing protein [Bacteroidetes bacterium]|nr:T9SS type A sorting domain-containing protein [Bacteroidota bacterium]